MPESYSTQLDRVQAAIAAIETGAQSYTIGDRALTRADLKTLYAREQRLLALVARQTNGGIRMSRAVPL